MYSKSPEESVKELIIHLLLIENEHISELLYGIFYNLCNNGCHYECIKLLIDSDKIDLMTKDNYAIRNASSSGQLEVVKLLLSTDKVDVTAQDNYAIRMASYYGHIEIVKLLLSTGKVDVTAKDNYAFRNACVNDHLEVVKLLLSTEKVDITAQDNFAIKYASNYGHSEIVKLLLLTGKVDITNISDPKILHILDQIKSKSETKSGTKSEKTYMEKISQMMKTNGICKIVIKEEKVELTTNGNANTDPSQIVKLMNDSNMIECEYDDNLSIFEYKGRVKNIIADSIYQ